MKVQLKIANAIKTNYTLQEISLRNNRIGNEGGDAIDEALKINSTIQEINLEGNQILKKKRKRRVARYFGDLDLERRRGMDSRRGRKKKRKKRRTIFPP